MRTMGAEERDLRAVERTMERRRFGITDAYFLSREGTALSCTLVKAVHTHDEYSVGRPSCR